MSELFTGISPSSDDTFYRKDTLKRDPFQVVIHEI